MGNVINERTKYVLFNTIVVLINIRFFLGDILSRMNIDTSMLSFFILILMLVSVDYTKLRPEFIFIGLIGVSSVFNFEALGPFLLLLLCYITYNISIYKVVLINQICLVVILMLVFFLVHFGILENNVYYMLVSNNLSYDGGFGNPNSFSGMIFFILLNSYILFKRKGIYLILIFIPVSLLIFSYTRSRTFLVAELVLVLSHLFLFLGKPKKVKWFYLLSPFVILVVYFYYSLNVDPNLDIILSKRLSYCNQILLNTNIKEWLIGSSLPEDIILDNSYVMFLFKGGILFLAFFFSFYFTAIYRNYRYIYPYLPIVYPFLLCGITESLLVSLATSNNVLLWVILYKYSKKQPNVPSATYFHNRSCVQC